MLCNILWPLETTMRALPNLVHSKRRLLVGAAALLLGLMQDAPAARQACLPQSLVRLGGITSNQSANAPSVSADGRYIAFHSRANDLDGDGISDIFVYDRTTCSLELASVSSTGTKGNGDSQWPSISDDGRFVAFLSSASNLVPADANAGAYDAFVRDRVLGTTTLVSVDSSGVQPSPSESANFSPSFRHLNISGNGQVVAFVSGATTLVPGDTNNDNDVFVRDLIAGTTERVSIATNGDQGDSPTSLGVSWPVLSGDGRVVAFLSSMNTLVLNDFNNGSDVFVRDRLLNTTVRASLDANGSEVLGGQFMTGPAITSDGRFVFFAADSANLVPGNVTCDGVFIRDLTLNTTSCPSLDPLNLTPDQNAFNVSVSGDGRFVAFGSGATHYVPGDTFASDFFVHDRTTGATQRASVSASGVQQNFNATLGDLSLNGQILAFESFSNNLVPFDTNGVTDVFVASWPELPSMPHIDLLRNGSFGSGFQRWQTFATPDMSYIVSNTTSGELRFYRVPPPPGTSNQAVVFQQSFAQVPAHGPVEARFRLGNSSTARKRISVLVHDADFSDLSVCTFWLEPAAPMREYVMRTHTTELWSNATIAFYAASAGSDGGFYRVDDVSLAYQPTFDDDVVDCVDPTAPTETAAPPGPTLLVNGDFSAGLAPWAPFGQITWQIASNVFEFVRPPGTPAGVLLQTTGQALSARSVLTASFYLGNSSSVRKRVTVLVHDQDFSDLSACTFWLSPNLPLSPFQMRAFATKAWTNATLSLYPSTVGLDEWIRLADAALQLTPGTALGTECLEPGADQAALALRGLPARLTSATPPRIGALGTPAPLQVDPFVAIYGTTAGARVVWQDAIDLHEVPNAVLTFQSSLETRGSRAVVQISRDQAFWRTIARLAATHEWTPVEIDLSSVGQDLLYVRLAFQVRPAPPGMPPDTWRVRQVRVVERR